jgi:hypothetical protein
MQPIGRKVEKLAPMGRSYGIRLSGFMASAPPCIVGVRL